MCLARVPGTVSWEKCYRWGVWRGHLVRFCGGSVAGGVFGKGTWYGFAGKVLQVSDGDAVVRDEVEAMDVGGDLFRSGEDL